jgi:hypothetical protein
LLHMSNTFDRAPWILERLWTYIFKVAWFFSGLFLILC